MALSRSPSRASPRVRSLRGSHRHLHAALKSSARSRSPLRGSLGRRWDVKSSQRVATRRSLTAEMGGCRARAGSRRGDWRLLERAGASAPFVSYADARSRSLHKPPTPPLLLAPPSLRRALPLVDEQMRDALRALRGVGRATRRRVHELARSLVAHPSPLLCKPPTCARKTSSRSAQVARVLSAPRPLHFVSPARPCTRRNSLRARALSVRDQSPINEA